MFWYYVDCMAKWCKVNPWISTVCSTLMMIFLAASFLLVLAWAFCSKSRMKLMKHSFHLPPALYPWATHGYLPRKGRRKAIPQTVWTIIHGAILGATSTVGMPAEWIFLDLPRLWQWKGFGFMSVYVSGSKEWITESILQGQAYFWLSKCEAKCVTCQTFLCGGNTYSPHCRVNCCGSAFYHNGSIPPKVRGMVMFVHGCVDSSWEYIIYIYRFNLVEIRCSFIVLKISNDQWYYLFHIYWASHFWGIRLTICTSKWGKKWNHIQTASRWPMYYVSTI